MVPQTVSHYQILKKLGQGGMGEVYLARDTVLQRKIALKILTNLGPGQDEKSRNRFQREARAAAALNHPNIVTIYELGSFDDQFYIAMEYVEGRSLRELINEGPIDLKRTLDIAGQLCDGLYKAHQAGIYHRDIKPENIILDPDDRLKILDFGIAKLKGMSTLTTGSSVVGTLSYVSPEIIQGRNPDHRSDIFSIGCVIYEMVTGERCFGGDYPAAVFYSIANDDPRPLNEIDPGLPKGLQKLVGRTLQKDPRKRHQSAQQMKSELVILSEKLFSESFQKTSLTTTEKEGPLTIEKLLEKREQIDRIIADEYTKQVTIMFCDVVGSTAYFETRGDLEGRAMIRRYVQLMNPIIEENSGQVIKTIGDGILASFHTPDQGAAAAVAMQRKMHSDNTQRLEDDRIHIRIALHSGQVVIDQSDVFGDVVNVASRLEQLAGSDDILVSSVFYQQIQEFENYQFSIAGEARFKGKSDKFPFYKLVWQPGGETEPSPPKQKVEPPAAPETGPKKSGIVFHREYRLELPAESDTHPPGDPAANPYMNRVKIQNIEDFYGRKSEVTKIYSRIGAARPQCISIVGERRIGKSSLLNFIYHPANRAKYLSNPDELIFVFVDFQEKREIDVPDFFRTIFDQLREQFGDDLEIFEPADYSGFKNVVTALDQKGLKLILLFDEFEVITKNKRFDTEFYSYARSLANNYNVAYVVSSGRNLQTLCHSREISDSPFFNIFSNLSLSQFSREETVQLIKRPAGSRGVDMEPFVDAIIDMAGYYPFFVQMACTPLFDQLKAGRTVDKTSMNEIREEFFDEAKVHFRQIWDICDEDKREVILKLAAGSSIPDNKEFIVKTLIKEGYVRTEKERPRIFSSPFEDYVIETFGAARGIKKRKRFIFW